MIANDRRAELGEVIEIANLEIRPAELTELLTKSSRDLLEEEHRVFHQPERVVLTPGPRHTTSGAMKHPRTRPVRSPAAASRRRRVTKIIRAAGAIACTMFFLDCLADEQWPGRMRSVRP